MDRDLDMEDEIYKLKCLHQTMITVCKDVSAVEDPVLAHFTMALGDIICEIEKKLERHD